MRPALPRWLRVVTITTHVTAVGAWVGLDIALIALTTHTHTNTTTALSELATLAAGLTIGTGVALAVHRPWGGLRRHHWIDAKIKIAGIVAVAGLTSITGALDAGSVLAARVCALVALIAATAVSVAKPWGTTSHIKCDLPSSDPRLDSSST